MSVLDHALLRRSPKVLLHDHLDGGLRPATIVELAAEAGHALPTTDVDDLAAWFLQGGEGSDLVTYLAAFEHTVAVLQDPQAIERAMAECVEDLAADGVVHAEVRYAPELSTAGGLGLDEVLAAMDAGARAGADGREISVGLLVCAMRQFDRAEEAFTAAARSRDAGSWVVGVDLAGPEAGFPASRHAAALRLARDAGLHVTLHAGEADGPPSIADALDQGAERLGHGVHVIDDVADDDTLGDVAQRVLDEQVPLEVCPTSNVHTGIAATVAEHPFQRLRELGFPVTLNTDNRLMSGVTATSEVIAVSEAFDLGLDDLEALAQQAAAAAFLTADQRAELAARVQRGFAALRP
jgi:adenosine deaminase